MNKLIDELLEYNITFNDKILYSLQELKENTDYKYAIILLNNIIFLLEGMIEESTEYFNSILHCEYNFESITINNYINDLYNAKYKIIDFLNSLNEAEILAEKIDDIKLG